MTEMPMGVDHVDNWERGDPYEQFIGRWSRRIAPEFLAWLAIPPGRRWLDVGSGTGALSEAIAERSDPASVVGVEPSAGFRATAQQRLGARATFLAGEGAQVPLADHAVDVTVSGLVLNFVPDPQAALVECVRVTAPAGTIAAYVWDYAEGMELLRAFWDAAIALDPGAAERDEGVRFPFCRPEPLRELFTRAGLASVETKGIGIETVFADFADLWSPFEGGQGPAPSYAMALAPEARERLRDRMRNRLAPSADGSIPLRARAWAVRGTRQ
jgi:SAM-dependent methyltransferase